MLGRLNAILDRLDRANDALEQLITRNLNLTQRFEDILNTLDPGGGMAQQQVNALKGVAQEMEQNTAELTAALAAEPQPETPA